MTVLNIRRSAPLRGWSPSPQLDCECLLAFVLGTTRSHLLAESGRELSPDENVAFFSAVEKRKTGLPVAYITGHKEFFGIDFCVNQSVLIPKPDTELLVEQALSLLSASPRREQAFRVADVCTGSGCVALALALNAEQPLEITATDISSAALDVARENARRILPSDRQNSVCFIQADLLADNTASFDLILSNPPYVPSAMARELLLDGRGEPLLALDGGDDGLALIKQLGVQVRDALVSGGYFLLETGEYHIYDAKDYLSKLGFTDILIHTDLGGLPRLIQAKNSWKTP